MADVFHLHYRALLNEQEKKKKSSLLKTQENETEKGGQNVVFLMHELALIISESFLCIFGHFLVIFCKKKNVVST